MGRAIGIGGIALVVFISVTAEGSTSVSWIPGVVGPESWRITPENPTTSDVIAFSGPTKVHDNWCWAVLELGTPNLSIDSRSHHIRLWFEPGTGHCPMQWDPVCGVQGEFGPLEQGDWLFSSSNPETPFWIAFHVSPAPFGRLISVPGDYPTIQAAIDAASDDDTITVSPGTYVENIHFRGKNIVLRSMDPTDPKVVASTIIDRNQAGSVVSFAGTENETCVLSGFTIRNGRAEIGAGICGGAQDSHTRAGIRRNMIVGNHAGGEESLHGAGGGIACCDGIIEWNEIAGNRVSINPRLSWSSLGAGLFQCNGEIRLNFISDNLADGGGCGGGLCECGGFVHHNSIIGNSGNEGGGLYGCDGLIEENEIAGNWAYNGAGFAHCDGEIRNNRILGNGATFRGGGLCWCNGTIESNRIAGNCSNDGAGLAYCDGAIQRNTIYGNTAYCSGGALAGCNGIVQHNTIRGNSADCCGGGLAWCQGTIRGNAVLSNSAGRRGEHPGRGGALTDCNGTITNNTIIGNSTNDVGGGLFHCYAAVQNCIVWGNQPDQIGSVFLNLTHSCIQDWTGGGEGNIADEPRFVDADGADDDPATVEDNDYRLSFDSPCIDAGKNEEWMWGAVDLDGNPRILYGRSSLTVDMGAYEFVRPGITAVATGANGTVTLFWKSCKADTYTIWSCVNLSTGIWVKEANVLFVSPQPSYDVPLSWTDPAPVGLTKFYRVEMK